MIFKNLFADERKTYAEFQKTDPKKIQEIMDRLKLEQLREFSNPSPIYDDCILEIVNIPKKYSNTLRNNFGNEDKYKKRLKDYFNKFKNKEK